MGWSTGWLGQARLARAVYERVFAAMNDEGYRQQLEMLRTEHRDLDDAIAALAAQTVPDQLQIARLKRKKLKLKDRIGRIEDDLTPDIIA